ncbi:MULTISPECIES: OmpH family outer membrane protein [Novosphingobium]|jgi:Skp family chaperone for outer membrane proteins|uniref:Outer membrane chaperone Skp n=1 Tax=Novosphingobium subterraneum TaxID=48936 RepID=A0A0B9A1P1_9SPHN|nr:MULTISPECIES: OmpH family outer membrane protein [Novosphingobium]KHS43268.1 outer membrane chaperone Skp [Novosphingobium subterraneum]
MKIRYASALLAGLAVLSVSPTAAVAQATSGTVTPGIAIANPSAVVAASAAYQTAQQQRPTTYKPQIDQANARKGQIEAQLKPLIDKLQADSKAANPNRAALQAQYEQIQQIEQAGQAEIQKILEPLNLSQQYVLEQIGDKLDAATQAAMDKKKITLVIDSQSVIKAGQVYNLNQDILTELNKAIPSAQLVPPAGWMPRAQREQQAQAQAAQQPATAAQPAKKAPEGR